MTSLDDNLIVATITTREVEILRLMAEGLTNREIAQKLVLSPETVKWYNKQSFSKLGVSNRIQAVARARELGLLEANGRAPMRSVEPATHNLPAELSSFVGREREIDEVKSLLQSARLVTLTGPGGTGKTRLALRVASVVAGEYANGVAHVSLATITDAARVGDKIAQELVVKSRAERSVTDSLKRYLRNREMLLVLDNYEHVLAAATLVAELLAAAPDLRVLTTSREALRLSGEHEYLVPPLTVPVLVLGGSVAELSTSESVALFIQRAQAASTGFALTEENGWAVAGICSRLEGLPLAIELAAARIKLFNPQQLLQRLESRLDLLTGGSRDRPARQRTLRYTIEWSYHLLDPDEQKLFSRLAVFSGGCSLEAVEAICGPGLNVDTLDGLQSLLNKSLLYYQQAADPGTEPRFYMLETVREYAMERLAGSAKEQRTRERHLAFFLKLVEEAEHHLEGSEQLAWYNRLESEHDNLRAALHWSQSAPQSAELALRLTSALGTFWDVRGYLNEGRAHLATALSRKEAMNRTRARAKALYEAARLAWEQGDNPTTRTLLEESFSIYRGLEPPDHLGLADAIRLCGIMENAVGNHATGSSLITESLAIYRRLEDTRGTARALWQLAWCAIRPGDYEQANKHLSEALSLYREIGDREGLSYVLAGLGEVALRLGEYQRAHELLDESLALRHEFDATWGIAAVNGTLGWLALQQGDFEEAEKRLAESLRLRLEIEDVSGTAWCLEKLAEIALARAGLADSQEKHEKLRRAAKLFGAADALRQPLESTIDLVDQPEYERKLKELLTYLDKATFAAAWDEGQALTLDQASAYALGGIS